jgi:hypothetical protein
MDLFEEELVSLFNVLTNQGVAYIMVGGFATNMHGYSRFTADLDIWIKDTQDNRERFMHAIADIGLGEYKEFLTSEFIPGWFTLALTNGMELDIMTHLANYTSGDFDECYKIAETMNVLGENIKVLHINHLIAEKQKLGRPKDLQDVEELLKIKSLK